MKKPASLRAHLLASVPGMARKPDQIKIFIEKGSLRSTSGPGLSYQYSYHVSVLITDYPGSPDHVSIPLLEWIRINQNELLANQNKNSEAIQMEVEFLNNDLVDLQFTVPLTERVIVKRVDGQLHYSYPPEPQLTEQFPSTRVQLMANGEVVAEWDSPAPVGTDIETPHPGRRPLDAC